MNYHARRFDRAAATYAAHADFQAGMAAKLMSLLPAREADMQGRHGGRNAENAESATGAGGKLAEAAVGDGAILEFGCGTGLLTRLLADRFPGSAILATDASPRMLAEAARHLEERGNLQFAECDASGNSPVPPPIARRAPYPMAASNAVVQWFPDLERHFRWTASLLAEGGLYLASGFGRDNFTELNSILSEPPFGYRDFPGHDPASVRGVAESAGLGILSFVTDRAETVFESPRTFLEAIRSLGAARRPGTGGALTRKALERLLRTYRERYPRGEGVAVTWSTWYALLRKTGRRPVG